MSLLSRLLSVGADRPLRRLETDVRGVNHHASRLRSCGDAALREELGRLRRISAEVGLPAAGSADAALALAMGREAARRAVGLFPFDVQMLGAAALSRGWVAEMRTGEGKTLAAVPAVVGYALAGRGVHVVTANEYLATRDAAWMGGIYRLLGLSVTAVTAAMSPADKRAAYRCDVTYGTARELGFDHLRDQLVARRGDRVQHEHWCAVVDEADFVLLDEARVPLVVTGRAEEEAAARYRDIASVVRQLAPGRDFRVDEEKRTVWLSPVGAAQVEARLGVDDLYAPGKEDLVAHLQLAMRATGLLQRDRDYVVTDGRVEIVDEFTGRVTPGRRWAEGLHQAVEAKEGVPVRVEAAPLVQTTTRSYFRRYRHLAGMTGTAARDGAELDAAYGLPVVAIPPHRPVIRRDHPDEVVATAEQKYAAAVAEITRRHRQRQPVLVGTPSVRHSEYIGWLLDQAGIPHTVLNAKQDSAEAAVIAGAGRSGAVTVATNMAGRGVDIVLGGNPEILAAEDLARLGIDPTSPAARAEHARLLAEFRARCREDGDLVRSLGGLCVLGVGRQESRRVDDQLRGRAGRQGDPGESRFLVSLQDDLVAVFGPPVGDVARFTGTDGGLLTDPRAGRLVSAAQATVERRNRDLREQTRTFDGVIDHHFRAVCHTRDLLLDGHDLGPWTRATLEEHPAALGGAMEPAERYRHRQRECGGPGPWAEVQRGVMLAVLAQGWSDYLVERRDIRRWINFVALGGRYPITEWRRHAEGGVEDLWHAVEVGYLRHLFLGRIGEAPAAPAPAPPVQASMASHPVAAPPPPPRPPEEEAARARGGPHRSPWRRAIEGALTADWLQGFAGPAFEEIVVTLDDAGAGPPDGSAAVNLDLDDPARTVISLRGP
jgi:preprotein translocase subunit SecA